MMIRSTRCKEAQQVLAAPLCIGFWGYVPCLSKNSAGRKLARGGFDGRGVAARDDGSDE